MVIVIDNAKYQKCTMVTGAALAGGIDPVYIPPYSPNLNLIERLWQFVKKHALQGKHFEKFAD